MNVIRRFRGGIREAKPILYLWRELDVMLDRRWVVSTISSIEGDAGKLGRKHENG